MCSVQLASSMAVMITEDMVEMQHNYRGGMQLNIEDKSTAFCPCSLACKANSIYFCSLATINRSMK